MGVQFLEDLIQLMESEEVEMLCRCHHLDKHHKYYHYFKDLISWRNIPPNFPSSIYFLHSVVIHMLIISSVNNHQKTKNLPQDKKYEIRKQIEHFLKKRYIIEQIYGENCLGCGEFNTKEHLNSFIYHHIDERTKTIKPSDIFYLPCSEIICILKKEKGGIICHNCHTVLHYKRFHLFEQIYKSEKNIIPLRNDYIRVHKNFTLIQNINLINNPLKKSTLVSEKIEKYISAIYELSKVTKNITSLALREYLGLKSTRAVLNFFKENKFIKLFVDIKKVRPYSFTLNYRGKETFSLLSLFKDFYKSS